MLPQTDVRQQRNCSWSLTTMHAAAALHGEMYGSALLHGSQVVMMLQLTDSS